MPVASNQPVVPTSPAPAVVGGSPFVQPGYGYPTYAPQFSGYAPVQPAVNYAPVATSYAAPIQQSVVAQPVVAQPVAQSVAAPIRGESRIEYVPYQRAVMEYEEQEYVQYVPRERRVTDYYAVEYQTEYVPQVFQEKYTGSSQ